MTRRNFLTYLIPGLIILGSMIALMFIGCETSTGSIDLALDVKMKRTIEPSIDMQVSEYAVTITDSSSNVVYDQVVTGDTTIDGLLPDTYTVDVVGRNSASTPLGSGSDTASVSVGSVTQLTITVVEYSGQGTLDLTTTWPAGVVTDPNIDSTIAYGTDPETAMNWTLAGDGLSAEFFDDTLNNGWYSVVFKLFDDGAAEPSAGFATLARIVKDNVTSGTIDLSPNAATGGIELLMETDFYEVLDVTVDQPEGSYNLTATDTMTINASSTDGTVLWNWYRNGVFVDSTASYTIDASTLTVGNSYRYDLLALSSDNKSGWSGTWNVTVVSFDGQLKIVYTPTPGNTYDLKISEDVGTGFVTTFEMFDDDTGEFIVPNDTLPDGDYIIQIQGNDPFERELWEEVSQQGPECTTINIPLEEHGIYDFGTIDY